MANKEESAAKKTRVKAIGLLASICAAIITIANVEEAAWRIRKAWAYFTEEASVSVALEKPSTLNYVRGSSFRENIRIVNHSRYVRVEVKIQDMRIRSKSEVALSLGVDGVMLLEPGQVSSNSLTGVTPDSVGLHSLAFDVVARAGFADEYILIDSEEASIQVWHEYPSFQVDHLEIFEGVPGDRRSVVARGYLAVSRAAQKGLSCSALLEDDLEVRFRGLSFPAAYPGTIGRRESKSNAASIAKWSTRAISDFVKIAMSLSLEIGGNTNERRLAEALVVNCSSVM